MAAPGDGGGEGRGGILNFLCVILHKKTVLLSVNSFQFHLALSPLLSPLNLSPQMETFCFSTPREIEMMV